MPGAGDRRPDAGGSDPSARGPVLLRDGQVLADLEIASTRRERRRGLLGRDAFDGALLFPNTRSVHGFGMRFALDVALLDGDDRVVQIVRLEPNRLVPPRRRVRHVIEAEAGSFDRWNLRVGDRLEIPR